MGNLTEKFVIGRLGKARGLKGEIKVFPLTDNPKRFNQLTSCFLEDDKGNVRFEKKLAAKNVVNQEVYVRFEDILDREQAESLRGLYLSVLREDAIPLDEDSFFIADLIGLQVIDSKHGDLGKIASVQDGYSADVIIVKKNGEKDLLFPNRKLIVQEVDLKNRCMNVTLPDGLYEIYRED